MGKEREIKLRIDNVPVLRRALTKLGARVVRPRLHEHNVLFDTDERTLASREELLRIRTELLLGRGRKEVSRFLVTFKRLIERPASHNKVLKKDERHKVREEIELEVSDAAALTAIFEGLGMSGWFQYEKFRTTFRLPVSKTWAKGLLIELDETPIGVYLELEGPASAIDRAAKALGFENQDYILANYLDLYREYCRRRGEEPRDMLFANGHSSKPVGGPSKSKLFL